MTGDMEYGRGKRRHDKRDLSDDECDGESICNISSMKKTGISKFEQLCFIEWATWQTTQHCQSNYGSI